MKLDPAIARKLSLDPATAHLSAHGGSGFSKTMKLLTTPPKHSSQSSTSAKHYFVKTGVGKDAATMFAGEYASLNAIHAAVPSLCPQAHAAGELEASPGTFYLVTDFLDLSSHDHTGTPRKGSGSGLSLVQKLARLHTTSAPIPEGCSTPVFGFPVTTCCGDSEQPNSYTESWAEFYAENRLLSILKKSERTNRQDPEMKSLVEKTAKFVVPRLLGDEHLNGGKGVQPVVIHGDLWSGNHGKGSIDGGAVEDVVFDPSSSYAHSEYELGIMKMFGGFGVTFLQEYHKLCPKTEPIEEYEDRISLYEL